MTLPAPAGAVESASGTGKVTGGIAVGATRVIYNEADNGAAVRVINTSSIPFLIQTWVESYKRLRRRENGRTAERHLYHHAAALPSGQGREQHTYRACQRGLPRDHESSSG
ncbi:fimbria/pilus periplasmic chaperone [Citrobacter koseri]|uniref:fimbria/pilus periplasmic chaperone n=1 Tax=Citrobacter koseri TaxID=545 RepID=UPI00388F862F